MSDDEPYLLSDPWLVDAADFPETGAPADKIHFLLNYAVLAPSILNVQPWRFRVNAGAVLLYRDRSRLLPVVDPQARQMTISCGAALLNLRVASRGFGYDMAFDVQPDVDHSDLLARAWLTETKVEVSDLDRELRDQIQRRRTNRHTFEDRELSPDLINALAQAAEQEGVRVTFLRNIAEKREVASLIAKAETAHLADPDFRRELANWIRARIAEAHEHVEPWWGLAGASGQTPGPIVDALITQQGSQAAREFAHPEAAAEYLRAQSEASPVLALLSTSADDDRTWLAAGQALQRMLLNASRAGVSASYLNPPIEIAGLRAKLAHVIGIRSSPQVMLRLGYGTEIPAVPRRPVSDVVAASGLQSVDNAPTQSCDGADVGGSDAGRS